MAKSNPRPTRYGWGNAILPKLDLVEVLPRPCLLTIVTGDLLFIGKKWSRLPWRICARNVRTSLHKRFRLGVYVRLIDGPKLNL